MTNTNNEPEWGPWIEHDGLGCPCVGQYVHVLLDTIGMDELTGDCSDESWGIAGDNGGESWDWSNGNWCAEIIRYRIRKPKGMQILQGLLRDVEYDTKEVIRKIMEPV